MHYFPYYPIPQMQHVYAPHWIPYYNYWAYAPYVTNLQSHSLVPAYRKIEVMNSRQYPEVDPTVFNESAVAFKKLLQDASTVLDKLASSKVFASKIMSAAQESNLNEVDNLIKSTGIQSNFKTSFNPDGIEMYFWSEVEETECCKLDMKLRWN
ncbi:hypothetical protein [Bacillus sp. Marseille-P3661]|uniref:hypothetical protein n=1 Tax=Bacillus sp. Marseille-P3661 TaxID=1936234 RepID=UPI000C8553CE|nr:hypothetical protein [Bacillus sp. Marseille-P3661]